MYYSIMQTNHKYTRMAYKQIIMKHGRKPKCHKHRVANFINFKGSYPFNTKHYRDDIRQLSFF